MTQPTIKEIIELIEGLIESDTCMGRISDKQVIESLDLVAKIKAEGIAPPDGMVLVPIEPTATMLDVLGKTANNSWNRAEWYANMLAAAPKGVGNEQ